MSDQETQSLSSMETAEPSILTVDLFGRARASPPPDGFPRTATFAVSARRSLPAGQSRSLGVPEQPAPRTARAGTPLRGRRPGSGPPSQLQAEAPVRPDPPSEARYLGRGWGRDGGQGSGKRAQRRQGQLQQGKLPRRREDSVGKGKTPPAPRGGGEKSRAQARGIDKAREISRDQQILANVRSGHVTPWRPLSGRRLRPRKAEWVGPNGQEVACLDCARRRVPARLTSVPPCSGSGEWLASVWA